MNTPEITWRLRRIDTSLWPSVHARQARAWLRTASAAIRTATPTLRRATADHWLAALRERTA